MSKSQMSRLSPYAMCVLGPCVAADGGFVKLLKLCCGGCVCWSCQPCSPSPVLRAGLAGLTQISVVFLFVDANYCPPVGVLGLGKGFLEQELLSELDDISLALCWCVVLQEGKPRIDVLGVRQLFRIIKWGLDF